MLNSSHKNIQIQYYKEVDFIPAEIETRFITVILINGKKIPYNLKYYLQHNKDTDVYIIKDNRSLIPNDITYLSGVTTADCLYKTSISILLRNWWLINRSSIKVKKVLFIEYDVFINTKISDEMFTDGLRTSEYFHYFKDILYTPEKSWVGATWRWGDDGDKLSNELKSAAVSTFTNILWFHTDALDMLILPEWDNILLNTDIICEASIPTILNYCKVPLYDWDESLCYKRCHVGAISIETELDVINRIKTNQPGIYHPVKEPIETFCL